MFEEVLRGNLVGQQKSWCNHAQTSLLQETQECVLTNPRKKLVAVVRSFVAAKPFEIVCADMSDVLVV